MSTLIALNCWSSFHHGLERLQNPRLTALHSLVGAVQIPESKWQKDDDTIGEEDGNERQYSREHILQQADDRISQPFGGFRDLRSGGSFKPMNGTADNKAEEHSGDQVDMLVLVRDGHERQRGRAGAERGVDEIAEVVDLGDFVRHQLQWQQNQDDEQSGIGGEPVIGSRQIDDSGGSVSQCQDEEREVGIQSRAR